MAITWLPFNPFSLHSRRLSSPGMTLAIEPMICTGNYDVRVLSNDWTAVTVDGSWAAHYENTLVITEDEPRLLTLLDGRQ